MNNAMIETAKGRTKCVAARLMFPADPSTSLHTVPTDLGTTNLADTTTLETIARTPQVRFAGLVEAALPSRQETTGVPTLPSRIQRSST
jgi:hypothetical protein